MDGLKVYTLFSTFLKSIPFLDLVATTILLGFTVAIMMYYELSITTKSIIAFGRAFIQLILLGGLLLVFFRIDNLLLNIFLCAIMVIVAAITAAQDSPRKEVWQISLIGQGTAIIVTLVPMTLLGVIDLKTSFFIPITAMVIRNTLNRAALAFERLDREMSQNTDIIEQYMALGIDAKTASKLPVTQSIEASMIPTINKLNVVGLVGLPGLMTGIIITADSGNLIEKIAYGATLQAVVLYLIFASSIISSIIVCSLTRRLYFNEKQQLTLNKDE